LAAIWSRSNGRRRLDALQRPYVDDLVYVHSTAVADSKASYIERQRSGLHYRAMRPSDVEVRVFGCLAIITGRGDYEVTQSGQTAARTCCSPASGRSEVKMCSLSRGNPQAIPKL